MGGEKDGDKKEKENKDGVFKEKWMNQCYTSLLYPNPNCVKLLDQIGKSMVRHVTEPLGSEFKQQALFVLLGPEYTEQHFPYHTYNPKKLEPPLNPKQKEKYLKEARVFIDKCLDKVIKDCGYPNDDGIYEYSKDDELGVFVKDIRNTFNEGLKKHTAVLIFQEEKQKQNQEQKRARKMSLANDGDNDDEDDGDDGDNRDGATLTPEDVAGQAVLAVLAHDPSKREGFAKSLREKHLALSNTLRAHFWWEHLVEKETPKLKVKKGQNVTDIIKDNFDNTLIKEMKKQKLNRATRSNDWKAIDNAVIEVYDNTTTLRSLDSDEHMIQTARAINLVNVQSKAYSTTYIYLLMPLQIALKQRSADEDEDHVMRLAINLELVKRHCWPDNKEIFLLSDHVIEWLETDDPEYLKHLKACLKTQISRINVRDFPPEVLLKDSKASIKLHEEILDRGIKEKHEEIFTDPAIFIRKWMGQVFVGVLSVGGSMWAWDQLFLDGWSHNTFRKLAVSIIVLIKPWMMRANMYSGARKVLLEEPGKLYLSDLRACLVHLESGGDLASLPPNKNYIDPSKSNTQSDGGGRKTKGEDRRKTRDSNDDDGKRIRISEDKAQMKNNVGAAQSQPRKSRGTAATTVLPYLPDQLFRIDLALDSDDDDDDDVPLPLPEPSPDTETESESSAPPTPTPPVTPPPPPPPPEHLAWVPHDQDGTEPHLPTPTRTTEPFDFYIDSVRFLPDHVTFCKVTARVVNMYASRDERLPDIVSFPIKESSSRCPTFRCKLPLNEDRVILNTNIGIVVRVYGYQQHHRNVAVVGTCLVKVFEPTRSPPTLCVGGVQRRIRHGLPNPQAGLENMVSTDMDDNDSVPGVSVCYRLLPSTQDYVAGPAYETGYYRSEECKPNPSEQCLFHHYCSHSEYKTSTVATFIRKAQQLAGVSETYEEEEMQKYLEETLDWRAQQKKTRQPVSHLDYSRYINYEDKKGIKLSVSGVFALPEYLEGYYCHVYCRIVRPDGSTVKDPFTTRVLDFLSYQRSPQWLDTFKTLHLEYDETLCLLLELYGFESHYQPGDGIKPGTLKEPRVKFLAWTFAQIFDKGCAISGVHWLPLLEGDVDLSLLSSITTYRPPHQVLLDNLSTINFLGCCSLEVRMCDGHVEPMDVIEPRVQDMVERTGRTDMYAAAQVTPLTNMLDNFYLEGMTEKEKQKGILRLDKERNFFEKQANRTFFKSLNKILEEARKPIVK